MVTVEKFLATTTPLSGGLARCDVCKQIVLEDDRHWHEQPINTPAEPIVTRTRVVEITEEWVSDCRELPGCKNADPSQPCCGEGHWVLVGEE